MNIILLVIRVLINVAFITLLERKILGYSQLRKGPNKVGFGGLLQPFNDAIKLFTKEIITPFTRNRNFMLMGPILGILFRLIIWLSVPINWSLSISLSIVIVYIILSINIYPLLMSGWASNRNYAMIGRIRGIAQTISYEIRFALIIIFFTLTISTLSLNDLISLGSYFHMFIMFAPIIGIWLLICLAETNRTPFDFAEGESELVSGFNIEYGSVGFALIFMAEYARIFFISSIASIIFSPFPITSFLGLFISVLIVFFWVWTRTTLPRYRYDILISLAWFTILPLSLLLVVLIISIKI